MKIKLLLLSLLLSSCAEIKILEYHYFAAGQEYTYTVKDVRHLTKEDSLRFRKLVDSIKRENCQAP